MNKKLRLIVTRECPRACPGCCNKDYTDVEKLQTKDIFNYDKVYFTGGEPMLYFEKLLALVKACKTIRPSMKLYLYTAEYTNLAEYSYLLKYLDGVTFTLHTDEDTEKFLMFNRALVTMKQLREPLSLRLNWFRECHLPELTQLSAWDEIARDKEWLPECPIPEGEDLRELETLWSKE